jgi:transcriptional regulator GlxA family with amidase domain
MTSIRTIGVLAYNKCGEQDTLAPWEIFKSLAWVLGSQYKTQLDVKLIVLEPGDIIMQMGASVKPEEVYDGVTLYDVLYVPGGLGSGQASLKKGILEIVQRHHEAKKIIACNCSGISILWKAGIIGDSQITAPSTVTRRLLEEGANLSEPRKMWLGLADKRLWTTVGGSGVHASTVAFIAYYFGEEIGKTIASMWDTLPQLGQELFSPAGPAYLSYPPYEKLVQDMMEEILFPSNELSNA